MVDEKGWFDVITQVVPIVLNELTKEGLVIAAKGDVTEQPKFWGILASVAASVLPSIIQAATKGYQAEPDEKGWFDVITQVVPIVLNELTKEGLVIPAKGDVTEQPKFWGILASVAAAVLPSIIQAATKG